jgi:hypothetical protein
MTQAKEEAKRARGARDAYARRERGARAFAQRLAARHAAAASDYFRADDAMRGACSEPAAIDDAAMMPSFLRRPPYAFRIFFRQMPPPLFAPPPRQLRRCPLLPMLPPIRFRHVSDAGFHIRFSILRRFRVSCAAIAADVFTLMPLPSDDFRHHAAFADVSAAAA